MPMKLSPEEIERRRKIVASGITQKDAIEKIGVSGSVLHQFVRRHMPTHIWPGNVEAIRKRRAERNEEEFGW